MRGWISGRLPRAVSRLAVFDGKAQVVHGNPS